MGNTDSIPVVSQTKSYVQLLCGDVKGAAKTQENFLRECPLVSQATSAVQFLKGDPEGALETQKRCGKAMSNMIDGVPAVGYVKVVIHYAVGDKEGGNRAMKSASRTTGVLLGGVVGFVVGGPVGAVAGGICGGATLDTVTTIADSAIHDEFRPSGYCAGFNNAINNPNPGDIFDLALMPVADGLAGYGTGKMVNRMQNSAAAQVLETPPRAQATKICVPNRATYLEQRTVPTSTGSSTSSISTVQVGVTATTSGNKSTSASRKGSRTTSENKSTSASGKGSEGTGSTGVNGGNGGDDERGSGWKNPAYDGDPPYENEISTSNARLIQVREQRDILKQMLTNNGVEDAGRFLREVTRHARYLHDILHNDRVLDNFRNLYKRRQEEVQRQHDYNVDVHETLGWWPLQSREIPLDHPQNELFYLSNNVICIIQDTTGQDHVGYSLRLAEALGQLDNRYSLQSQFPNISPRRIRNQNFRYFENWSTTEGRRVNELTRCAEHSAYESLQRERRTPRYTYSIMYRDGEVIIVDPCENCRQYPEPLVYGQIITQNMNKMKVPLDYDEQFDDQSDSD